MGSTLHTSGGAKATGELLERVGISRGRLYAKQAGVRRTHCPKDAKHPELRFHARLTEGASEVELAVAKTITPSRTIGPAAERQVLGGGRPTPFVRTLPTLAIARPDTSKLSEDSKQPTTGR